MGRSFRRVLASDLLTMLSVMVGQVTLPWWIAREGGARDLVLYASFVYGVSFVSRCRPCPSGRSTCCLRWDSS